MECICLLLITIAYVFKMLLWNSRCFVCDVDQEKQQERIRTRVCVERGLNLQTWIV